MKKNIIIIFTIFFTSFAWGQKLTIAEENLEKTRTAFLGKWEILTSGSQAEAKKMGIAGDYIEFTSVMVYPKPVHVSLVKHYKVEGFLHTFGSFADNKDVFPISKGDASFDPTTNTWSFGFQVVFPAEKPNEKRTINKSGLIRNDEMLISSYGVDKDGDPYSSFIVGVKLPAVETKE
jgi:hypothetical protein